MSLNGAPAELTSFVGRQGELGEVTGLVVNRRLVTLTGIGGCGKTRLAARVVERVGSAWRDGSTFVDLASMPDPDRVPGAVADAIGLSLDPDGRPTTQIAAHLQHRHLLLCLDTCEHVLDAAAELVELVLTTCPDLAVLATSREPLNVAGETVWQVPPLRAPEATQLFEERASLVSPRFDAEGDADVIAAICARVDHVPLAIELAAAWVRALSPAQIFAGLDDTFRLLVGGPRTAEPRHRTLDASMTWSVALLDEPERQLFRFLSVFPDTFTLEAAQAVGHPSSTGDPASHHILPLLGRLLDTSLLTIREVQGEIRYRFLDTVRQYAAAMLADAGEADGARHRHLSYVRVLTEEAEVGADLDQERWRTVLDGHRADVSAALQWGLAQRGAALDEARRLAAAIARHWLVSGQTAEGLPVLDRALALAPDDESALQARLHAGHAMLGMARGRLALVANSAERGAGIATRTGDEIARARCLAMAAFPAFFEDFERCATLAREAQAAAEEAGDVFSRDWAGVIEAYALQTRNRNEEAQSVARRVVARSRQRQDRFCGAWAHGVEIYTRMTSGDVRGAVAVGREVVELVRPLGDYFGAGTLTCNAAQVLAVSGAIDEAHCLLEPVIASIDPSRELDVVGFMMSIGLIHLFTGELDDALRWFDKGVSRLADRPTDWTAGRCLPGLVSTLRRLGRADEARRWAARGTPLLRSFQAPYEEAALLDESARLAAAENPDRARELHLQALVLRRDHGVRVGYPDSLDALAELATAGADPSEAVRLLGASDAARAVMGYPRPPADRALHDRVVVALRENLGARAFADAADEGRSADLDALVGSLTRGRGPRNGAPRRLGGLTPAELEVARLAAEGLTNPQIATQLYMSRSTVKAHLARIFPKLGVANRTALAGVLRSEQS